MDVLSDVLRVVRLTGAVFFDTHARAPWAIQSPAAGEGAEGAAPPPKSVSARVRLSLAPCASVAESEAIGRDGGFHVTGLDDGCLRR